jgi:RNA polymerase sigma factor (sigma-70 family)
MTTVNRNDPDSKWLHDLPAGDSMAQHQVVRTFAKRLETIANRYLAGLPKGDADGEDVANKVFHSLFNRVVDGRIVPPESREELGKLLVGMAKNKSAELARRKLAAKRGGGKVRGESGFGQAESLQGIHDVADTQANPQKAFLDAQTLHDLLRSLQDEQLRQIVLLRMAGYGNEEISQTLGCSKRTVERRVTELRSHFAARDASSDASTRV